MNRKGFHGGAIACAAAVVAVAVAYLGCALWRTGGRWMAPRDGAWVALVYADSVAEGHPFRFNRADPSFPWGTDPLYALLAAPFVIPAGASDGQVPVAGLFAVNAALLAWSCRSAAFIAGTLMASPLMVLAVLGLVLGGPFTSAFFGLDGTGLQIALTLALWAAWLGFLQERSARKWRAPAVLSFLAALTGPSGILLAAAAVIEVARRSSGGIPGRKRRYTAMAAGFTGPLVVLAVYAVARFPAPVFPAMSPDFWREAFAFALAHISGLWSGDFVGSEAAHSLLAVLPGAALLFILGLLQPGPQRQAAALGGAMWLAWLVSASARAGVSAGNRVGAEALYPLFMLVSFSGLGRLGDFVHEQWRKPLERGLAVVWLLLAFPALLGSIWRTGGEAVEGLDARSALAELPGEGGLVTDVPGVSRWFSGRDVLDLSGTVAPWMGRTLGRGWGALNDHFKGRAESPRYSWALLRVGGEGRPERANPPAGFLLATPGHARTGNFLLCRLRWGAPGSDPEMPGWRKVDELDCGSAVSEQAHGYRAFGADRGSAPADILALRDGKACDGGLLVDGSEEFMVSAQPGEPLVILSRVRTREAVVLGSGLNGAQAERVPLAPSGEKLQEVVMLQSDGKGVLARNAVKIGCEVAGRGYESFHYWVFQPEAANVSKKGGTGKKQADK